jgi:hypothetical protein
MAAEIMTPLERVASTPKGQLKSPYPDFANMTAARPLLTEKSSFRMSVVSQISTRSNPPFDGVLKA